jgi:hypothetical protein
MWENQVLVVVTVNQVKKEKLVCYTSEENKIEKIYILGETGEFGLPGIKGLPGDSGPCMYRNE